MSPGLQGRVLSVLPLEFQDSPKERVQVFRHLLTDAEVGDIRSTFVGFACLVHGMVAPHSCSLAAHGVLRRQSKHLTVSYSKVSAKGVGRDTFFDTSLIR